MGGSASRQSAGVSATSTVEHHVQIIIVLTAALPRSPESCVCISSSVAQSQGYIRSGSRLHADIVLVPSLSTSRP